MTTNNNNLNEYDLGYGLNINPKKIKKIFLKNIDDLKMYLKIVVYCNIIADKKLKFSDILNIIEVQKIDYKIDWL